MNLDTFAGGSRTFRVEFLAKRLKCHCKLDCRFFGLLGEFGLGLRKEMRFKLW